MTDTPIAAALERQLAEAGGAMARALADAVRTNRRLLHHGQAATTTEGDAEMGLFADAKDDLDKFTADLKDWTTTGYQDVVDFIENKGPKWSAALDNAANNPAIEELLNATHLSTAWLTNLAGLIRQAEQDAAAAATAAPPEPGPDAGQP